MNTKIVSRLRTKLVASVLALGALFAVTSLARDAHAGINGINCTLTNVWYDQYSGGRLRLFCAEDTTNAGFIANLNEPACNANRSLDTLKVWASMATAYQLANHKIFIEFNDAFTGCNIHTINNFR
jgi:hypothetical protein